MATPGERPTPSRDPAEREHFQKATEDARRSLKALLDELRVQAHLAGMEAKDAWEELEPQLGRMEQRLEEVSERLKQASDEAELQAHLGVKEAQTRWEALKDSLSDVVETTLENTVGAVVDKARAPKRVIDRSKVQAHLAKLEAEERALESVDELKRRLAQSRSEVLQEAAKFVDGLTASLVDWSERLSRRNQQ